MRELRPTPDWLSIFQKHPERLMEILELSLPEVNRTDRYLHWEKLRYEPNPQSLSSEEWWAGIKFHRLSARQAIPLLDKRKKAFTFATNSFLISKLHDIDLLCGGNLQSEQPLIPKENKERYYYSSLVEESITSSQLEGAAVTRADAKEMIRCGRKPIDTHERMIFNNFKTMQEISKWKDEPLSISLILRMHKLISAGTLGDSSQEGRLRRDEDKVRIEDTSTGEVIHVPPSAAELPDRLQKLCDWANETKNEMGYVHPVVRSILLHFWIAYEHPFVDGNGRTARALFYWSMLRYHFWLFEFISISSEILAHPKNYYRAFLYSESDDNDLNYFIVNQILLIEQSIKSLNTYIERKTKEQKKIENYIKQRVDMNHRQIQLIVDSLKNLEREYTVAQHKKEQGISTQTSRTDLAKLVKMGVFTCSHQGKAVFYKLHPDGVSLLTGKQKTK